MEDPRQVRRNILAQTAIKGLQSRNMTGYYAADKEEALSLALSLIPEKSSVTGGGSMTVTQIGLDKALAEGDYNYLERKGLTGEAKRKAEEFAYRADVFIGSVNAITADGILINIDGNANRVSAYAYGPKKLVLVVGMNKVAPDFDTALKRARNDAAVANVARFGLKTPCQKTGVCMDCKSPDTICCQFLVTRYEMHKGRIHVILVDESLGF